MADQAQPVPDEDEHTILVTREDDDAGDHTLVVARDAAEDDDEHTVMVDRGAGSAEADGDGDHTVVVARDSSGDDHTVVVDRPVATGQADLAAPTQSEQSSPSRVASPSNRPSGAPRPASKRRRGLTPPPVPEGFGPRAADAMGTGATETYTAREIPQITAMPVALEEGPQATRAAAPSMPSVARNSRRAARIAVASYAAAWVVTVLGIATMAFVVFR